MPDSTAPAALAPAPPPLWRRATHVVRRASAGAGRTVWLWWRRRTVTFRRTVRALALVAVTSIVSLLVGLSTASAQAPLGPHEATWSTTLDSTITLDMGPLGIASMDSPAGVLGLEVVPGEIPSKPQPEAADAQSVGQALSSDVASYIGVVSHPELTIQRGLHALLHDALRRAGLIESLILCLVAAGRLATTGRLRDTLAAGLRRRPPAIIAGAAALCTAMALLVPAVRSEAPRGTTLEALEGTPLAQARFSGRIADVVAAYGPRVTSFLKDNQAFYSAAETNLRAAWSAAQDTGGLVDVTAAQGSVDREDLDQRLSAVSVRRLGRPAPGPGQPTDEAAEQATEPAPEQADGAGPTASAGPSAAASTPSAGPTSRPPQATGARAVERRGTTTAVMSTDLHCNLDVITFTGILDRLAGADIHMDDGDLTMTGSEPEQLCVDALSQAVPASAAKIATVGNHDSDSTAQRLRSQGWTVTDGTIQSVGGLRVLGDEDPDRTIAATGTSSRRGRNAAQVGAGLAATSCTAPTDVVLIHQPATFGPLTSQGCAPLLLAGHVHAERGMSTLQSPHGPVSTLISGAGKGGTSLGSVTEDAYLHVLSFDRDGALVAWRAVVLHPDASVTVGAWQPVPPPQPPDEAEQANQEAGAAPTDEAVEPDETTAS